VANQSDFLAGENPTHPGSPGGVLISPEGGETVPSLGADYVWKGDGSGGWVQGAVPASAPLAHDLGDPGVHNADSLADLNGRVSDATLIDTADARLSNARTPTGAATGDLTGTFPAPSIAPLAVTDAKVAAANKDGTAGTASMRTLGAGAQQATAGNDGRLSDARTPTSHGLGGGEHATATLAQLNAKISDADLIDSGAAAAATKEPTGFVDGQADVVISWSDVSKVLTVTPTGADFDLWQRGVKFTKTAETKDVSGSIAEGFWFFYYDTSGVLQGGQTVWDLEQHAPVAFLYWDATNSKALNLALETHGTAMGWSTHRELHLTVGALWQTGLAASGNVAGDGSVASHAQIAVGAGTIHDEDLMVQITSGVGGGLFEQDLGLPAKIPVWYLDGSGPVWRKKTANTFPLLEGTSRIKYNQFSSPNWLQTDVASNGRYAAIWLFATNNQAEPVMAILGQSDDGTLANAKENNTLDSLSLAGMFLQEMKVIARLIFQSSSSYGNASKARLRDVLDLRDVSSIPSGGFIATTHNSLAGRDLLPSHPASALTADVSAFGGALSATEDTVQKALDKLDDNVFGLNYTKGVSEAESTTTTKLSSWDDKLTVALPAITGTMLVTARAEVSTLVKDKAVACRLYNSTDAVVLGDSLITTLEGGDTSVDWLTVEFTVEVVLAGTGKDMKIQWADDSTSTAKIRRARIFAWRVA